MEVIITISVDFLIILCYDSHTNFMEVMVIKTQTACFTGHREIPANEYQPIRVRVRETLVEAIRNGYRFFGSGGALGFDTLAAQVVLELKKEYPEIRLILVLPCLTQAKYWKLEDIRKYELIKKDADRIVYISKEYSRECMFKRNRHLADNSSLCICYLAKETGGTAYTVEYAKKKGLSVINLV